MLACKFMIIYEISNNFFIAKQGAIGYICVTFLILAVVLPILSVKLVNKDIFRLVRNGLYTLLAVLLFVYMGVSCLGYLEEKKLVEQYYSGDYYQMEGTIENYSPEGKSDSFTLVSAKTGVGLDLEVGMDYIGYSGTRRKGSPLKDGDKIRLRYVSTPLDEKIYIAYIELLEE